MPRNYDKEAEWIKKKYIHLNAFIDRSYEPIVNKIKEDMPITVFIRKAIELYGNNPELFNEKED